MRPVGKTGGGHVFEEIRLKMEDLLFPIDGINLQQGEILLSVAADLNVGLENVRSLRRRIQNGVDPLDDFLLLGEGELRIKLPGGHVSDFGKGGRIEEFDGIVGEINDENADGIGLFIDLLQIVVVAFVGDRESYDQNDKEHQKQKQSTV